MVVKTDFLTISTLEGCSGLEKLICNSFNFGSGGGSERWS